MLEFWIVRFAQRVAEVVWHEERSRGFYNGCYFVQKRNRYGGNPGTLYLSGNQANCLNTKGSDGCEKHRIDAIVFE